MSFHKQQTVKTDRTHWGWEEKSMKQKLHSKVKITTFLVINTCEWAIYERILSHNITENMNTSHNGNSSSTVVPDITSINHNNIIMIFFPILHNNSRPF